MAQAVAELCCIPGTEQIPGCGNGKIITEIADRLRQTIVSAWTPAENE